MGNLINSGAEEPKKLSAPKIRTKNIWSKHKDQFSPLLQKAKDNLNKGNKYESISKI